MNAVELMFPPFVAAMLLVAIHGYFGLHIIARGVIFVDLALAQMAALGATTGLLFQIAPDSTEAHFFAVGAVAAGAAILAATRTKERTSRVPHEAIIGIVYVVASAAAILVADKAPRGADVIKDILVGSLLWITWPTIAKDAIAYALIGLALFLFRKQFWAISFSHDDAEPDWRVRWWDFLFYLLFGITVTFSVPIAGVLLVFTFLVVPAVTAFIFAERPGAMMAVAWSTGTFACTLGLYLSYKYDLPTGPLVVCTFGAVLLLSSLLHRFMKRTAAS